MKTILRPSYLDGHQDWASRLARYGQPVAFGLFGVALLLTVWNLAAPSAARDRVSSQNRVTLSLERLLSAVLDLETGSRGYVLAGEDRYLDPYRTSQSALDGIEAATKTAW